MRRIFVLMMVLAACAEIAFSSELAEMAKRERERRAKTQQKSVVSLNNSDLKNVTGGRVSQPDSKNVMAPAQPGQEGDANAPKIGVATDSNGNGQAYWTARTASGKKEVSDAEAKLKALESDIPRLNTVFVNTDDPGQRTVRKQELDAAMAQLDGARQAVTQAKAGLDAIREEGRRAGALPGWLR